MNLFNKERIKSILVVILLITSLVQVGILWSYSQRFPTSFLSAVFGGKSIIPNDEMAREELFVPFKLVVSNGNMSHWVISRDNDIFMQLWEEARDYLNDIAAGELMVTLQNDIDWGNVTSRNGFSIEFKTNIKSDLMKWFLDVPSISTDMPSVLKMMVVPDPIDENESSNEVYLYSDEGKIYKCKKGNKEFIEYARSKSFQSILTMVSEDKKGIFREYKSMRDSNFDRDSNHNGRLDVNPDVLYVLSSPKFWDYYYISCTIPEKIRTIGEKADDFEDILLGSEKDRYTPSFYNDGTLQLSTEYNVYKVFSDGYFEYNNMMRYNSSDRGSISDAIMNAYKMIKQIKKLTNSKAGLYLSGINDSEQGFYRLFFDYELNGVPVYINYESENTGANVIKNAVVIDVNAGHVIKCSWLIRDLVRINKNTYNDHFFDLMKNSGEMYTDMAIKDINVGYVVDVHSNTILNPLMVIEKRDSSILTARMPVGKGG